MEEDSCTETVPPISSTASSEPSIGAVSTTNTTEKKRSKGSGSNDESEATIGIASAANTTEKERPRGNGSNDEYNDFDADDANTAAHTTGSDTNHIVEESTITKLRCNHDDSNQETQGLVPVSKELKGNAKLSFAPSIEAYLNQLPQEDGRIYKTGSVVQLKYIPRPEWCSHALLEYMMKAELNKVKQLKGLDVTKMPKSFCGNCSAHLNEWIKSGWKGFPQNRTIAKVDFVTEQMVSNIIYFDINSYNWKTEQIQSARPTFSDKNTTAAANLGVQSSSTPPGHQCQCTYETFLIQQQQYSQQVSANNGNTILHIAIQKNLTNMAMEIIQIEYNTYLDCLSQNDELKNQLHITLLESTNDKEETPLIIAAQMGNIKIIQELQQCGVKFFDLDEVGTEDSVIWHAVNHGHTNVIEYVKECFAWKDVDLGPFHISPWERFINQPASDGTSPLICAVKKGNTSMVQLLLENGASPDDCQKDCHMTALMYAAQSGYLEICKLLISYDADIDAHTSENSTPLIFACMNGHLEIVQELVSCHCNINFGKDRNESARDVILSQMQRRSEMSGEDDTHTIQSRVNEEILRMLDPLLQLEIMQSESRIERNYRICIVHKMLQNERAFIRFNDGSTFSVYTTKEWLARVLSGTEDNDSEDNDSEDNDSEDNDSKGNDSEDNDSEDNDEAVSVERQMKEEQNFELSYLPKSLTYFSTQVLLCAVLLPTPILQNIVTFLPPPMLWLERLHALRRHMSEENSNDSIVSSLDVIDEILEDGGFLSACDAARIPAPTPYPTWCEWRQSINPPPTPGSCHYCHRYAMERSGIAYLSPLEARSMKNPSILVSRRQIGYLSLLSEYQNHTDIVSILAGKPYLLPKRIICQLIRIADIASICRRLCSRPTFLSQAKAKDCHGIDFDTRIASNILSLAYELYRWHVERDENIIRPRFWDAVSSSDSDDDVFGSL